jgi:4-hydroxy-4-methyl-2-oxoglutarate aldolase
MVDTTLQRLKKLDSCCLSDALDSLELSGVLLGLRRLSGDKPFCGRVVTVQLGAADGRPPTRHLCTAAVEAAGSENVILVAHNGRTDVAGWGGILSLSASQRGVAGVVVDGAVRDIDESRELGLSVQAREAVPITARGRIVELDWDVPVTVCGVEVHPGAYLFADGSGVVVVPQDQIDTVLSMAERIAGKERQMAADVHNGVPVSQVMGKSYEVLLDSPERDA